MKLVLVASIALLCSACVVTRQTAVSLATEEITRRKLPLPKQYVIEADYGCVVGQPTVHFWTVMFRASDSKTLLYTVWVNDSKPVVDAMLDSRHDEYIRIYPR